MAKLFTHELLQRELTRKDFIKYTLGFMLMILGISNFIANIRRFNTQSTPAAVPEQGAKKGFGTSKFGV